MIVKQEVSVVAVHEPTKVKTSIVRDACYL